MKNSILLLLLVSLLLLGCVQTDSTTNWANAQDSREIQVENTPIATLLPIVTQTPAPSPSKPKCALDKECPEGFVCDYGQPAPCSFGPDGFDCPKEVGSGICLPKCLNPPYHGCKSNQECKKIPRFQGDVDTSTYACFHQQCIDYC